MILDKIVADTRKRLEIKKSIKPIEKIKKQVENLEITYDFPFEKSLNSREMSFICEVKKASPSKGIIVEKFDYLNIAKEYDEIGASAISVLTEPRYFLGCDKYLEEIVKSVDIPAIRKDFIVDTYQIYESKILGASAILLISSLMNDESLRENIKIAEELGMSVLVESHTEKEIEMALLADAKIIGVNNRNLKNFQVDINNSIKLRKLVPKDKIFVAESGIKTPEDIKLLYKNNVNAVLIGEAFMRSNNKKEDLLLLRGGCDD